MKKVLATVMALAMAATMFAGCSKSSGSTSTTDSEQHEDCEITYLTWAQSSDNSYPQNMIDAFEKKYPWITVNLEVGSSQEADYEQAQKVKFLAGDGIDVTTLYPMIYSDYIKAGYLEELTGADYLKNYTDSTLESVKVDDKVYAVPYAKDVVGVMYNKDLFAKNGWKVPTCREDWLSLCETIAKTGVTPMVNGAKDAWPLAHEIMPFMQELYVNNPEIFNDIKSGKVKYTDDEFKDTFNEIQDYFKSSAVSKDAIGLTYDQSCTYFASGKAAMICHGEWAMDSITSASPSFDIGVFQVPYNKKGEKQVGAAEVGQIQAMASCSKNKDAAKLFLEYISSKEGAQFFADSMGNFTAVDGVSADGKDQWNDLLSADSVPFYYDQMTSGASSELFKQLQLMYIGNTTVDKSLAAIQAAQDKKSN